jgi:PadR family transcriptional regulator, regulatory protein PadR
MAAKEVLGEFEHHVLLATMRLGEAGYTSSILRELEERTGREVSAAAVYIALRRLERHGLIRSRLRRAVADGERRERRHFMVTTAGAALAREARRRLTRLWEDLDGIAEA